MTSLTASIIATLRIEPDRCFTILDLIDTTGASKTAVRKAVSRLSKTGKESGPIRRVSRGMYRYDPSKEHKNLQALARSGNWKIENICFVTKRTQGGSGSQSNETTNSSYSDHCDVSSSGYHQKSGYPQILPTGQEIYWEIYPNGTQIVRLATNGAPPFSSDSVLNILHFLGKEGFNDFPWECKSLELNVDDRYLRIDASYTLEVVEGLFLKMYQHGYNARLEVAMRRSVSIREMMDLFHAIGGGLDGTEALRRVVKLEQKQVQTDKTARCAYKIATRNRDRVHEQGFIADRLTARLPEAAQEGP